VDDFSSETAYNTTILIFSLHFAAFSVIVEYAIDPFFSLVGNAAPVG